MFSAYLSSHLSAAIYEEILKVQKSFSTTIVLSGSGDTSRTGKSLMSTCWGISFFGTYKPNKTKYNTVLYQGIGAESQHHMKITPATLFNELSAGRNIYCK